MTGASRIEPEPGGARGAPGRAEQILDRLETIFLREGFRAVSVGALAARLHCSRRTLYELAPSKEALFLRVLERFLGRIRRLGREAAASRQRVRERLVACLAPGISELRAASARFFADVESLPEARAVFERHQSGRIEDARGLIEEGIERGVFRGIHARLVAEVILAAVQHVMSPEFLVRTDLGASEAVAEVEDLILHGLLHPRRRRLPATVTRPGSPAPPDARSSLPRRGSRSERGRPASGAG